MPPAIVREADERLVFVGRRFVHGFDAGQHQPAVGSFGDRGVAEVRGGGCEQRRGFPRVPVRRSDDAKRAVG